MGLILHCGGVTTPYSDVEAVVTPAATNSHHPIPHATFIHEVKTQLSAGNFEVSEEAHSLAKDGMQYFGLMTVKPVNRMGDGGGGLFKDDKDGGLTVGLRNSHDKAFSAGLVVGYKVNVCDNLLFSGDIQVARKHTRFIKRDLRRLTSDAFGRMISAAAKQQDRIAKYREAELSDTQAHDLLVRGIDTKAIVPQQLPRVLKEWREPTHQDFAPRTVWSLMNGFTEIYKQDAKLDLTRTRSIRLSNMMDAYLGLGV